VPPLQRVVRQLRAHLHQLLPPDDILKKKWLPSPVSH
jgi:hypothetical protein